MNILEVKKIVGSIKSQLFKKSNSFSIGMLKSHFRGSGLQFKEHRQYTHGDDVRFIDWKILAKTGDPFVKTFEEERNVQIAVVIDAGPSMYYGWKDVSKLQAAFEIACLLYLLAEETNDSVHVIVLSNKIIDVPAGNGERGIVQLISTLCREDILTEEGKVNYKFDHSVIDFNGREIAIKKHLSRNREIVMLSDWIDLLDSENFKKLVFNRNSHCFRVLAPVDYATKMNFTTKASSGSSLFSVMSMKKKRDAVLEMDIKKIKDIHVDGRYLDEFVREMI